MVTRMSLAAGYEGYLDPSESDYSAALSDGSPIIVDTNVLLDLYSHPAPVRRVVFEYLRAVRQQLWIPPQVASEFWRNRLKVVADVKAGKAPLAQARQDLNEIVNQLTADGVASSELADLKVHIDNSLAQLEAIVASAQGEPLNVGKTLESSTNDDILSELLEILEGRVGAPLSTKELDELIQVGLDRFEQQIPPGYEDQDKSVHHEKGAGDYLVWEQALRHVKEVSPRTWILVSNEQKKDWRLRDPRNSTKALGSLPALVQESYGRTSARVYLLSAKQFYRLMSSRADNDADRETVAAFIESDSEGPELVRPTWSYRAYLRLLDELGRRSHGQQLVVVTASFAGGFIPRRQVLELLDRSADGNLVRFALPSQNIADSLVDQGVLDDGSPYPLEALYDGPGKTKGYRVPDEFVGFEQRRRDEVEFVDVGLEV